IASSKIESQYYKKVYPKLNEKIIVRLPNPVNIPKTPPEGSFRRKWGLKDDQIVLYLGRIHERKGLDLLVRAFNQIKDDKLKLVIAGPDDHYLKRLKKLISDLGLGDRIILTGPLYGLDKFEVLVDADVFVLPSSDEYESFGMAAAEAIACGTPIVVTSNCGVSEWIDSTAGLIVEADEKSIKDAITKILKSGSFHPKTPRIFKIERIARKFNEIYKNTIK
ncbi:glycosyltransferase, partial [Candidatus Bipolaricaulota bacterium]|nr:glycosyltransferase [Candidatus Bipolaricaulota bacterium]